MADLMTTNQVQELLQVDRTTIYRMVEAGELPALRVGKQWRFPREDFERWLRSRHNGNGEQVPAPASTPRDATQARASARTAAPSASS